MVHRAGAQWHITCPETGLLSSTPTENDTLENSHLKCGSEINRLHRQKNQSRRIFPPLFRSAMVGEEKKKKEQKKEKDGRQVGAGVAIYPMQSEVIAYHSVAPVSSIKSPRRACEPYGRVGVLGRRSPNAPSPPFPSVGPCSLRLKLSSV